MPTAKQASFEKTKRRMPEKIDHDQNKQMQLFMGHLDSLQVVTKTNLEVDCACVYSYAYVPVVMINVASITQA